MEEPGGGWATWLRAPRANPACPFWLRFSHGLGLPKLAALLRLTSFQADAIRQSWQLPGSRAARSITSKCICYIQTLTLRANRVSVQRRQQRCSCPSCVAAGKLLPQTPWSHSPQGGLLLLSPPTTTPKDPSAGSTRTGCSRHPTLLCFADNLFSSV